MGAILLGLLTGGWSRLLKGLSSLSFWQAVSLGCAVLILVQHFEIITAHHGEAKAKAQLVECSQGREADRTAYMKAQADAAALNKVQVAKVEAQQRKITDDVETRYQGDLARLRADNQRLSQSGVAPAQRPSSGAGSPQASAAPSRPDAEALPFSGPDLLQARECELQLNALIDWNSLQSSVDTNTGK